ncbi:uncharacterized protein LOC112085259 [Eutrema salsugineum]|uniref:uncharacterized protein LOC112085259 n=1 Tax=Eutrema salsugineum TaxID=72664 RepID=UPI000CED3D9C|nr:uncharacterized protein LOC112085259 [Eutrema salsugineum]
MDKPHLDPTSGKLTDEYASGIEEFITLTTKNSESSGNTKFYCLCLTCRNNRVYSVRGLWNHLYRNGFMPGYKIWYMHGETESMVNYYSSASGVIEEPTPDVEMVNDVNVGSIVQMVNDAFQENVASYIQDGNRTEEPNLEAQRFFDMLDAAKQPLYGGCREGISPLYSASRLMTIKMDFNLAEDCVDAIADFVKDILPEDNISPVSYYEIQKLVSGLGLPYEMIDVCIDNCMIFWRNNEHRLKYKFCHKPRYQETSSRVPVPHKRIWYLPIKERLKRLYQSERTAAPMRWHAQHNSDGEIAHPSDAEAWKRFQELYPSFASEPRNVYLGLSTDGFNLFGKHGRQYSLWPVIVTPYNLPPSLCMKREFLFLTILVPGPEHPKRSLDIFL